MGSRELLSLLEATWISCRPVVACRSHVEHEVDAAVDEQTLPPGRGVAAHDESPARQLAHHHVADP